MDFELGLKITREIENSSYKEIATTWQMSEKIMGIISVTNRICKREQNQ